LKTRAGVVKHSYELFNVTSLKTRASFGLKIRAIVASYLFCGTSLKTRASFVRRQIFIISVWLNLIIADFQIIRFKKNVVL
jgi:hypothetical protein